MQTVKKEMRSILLLKLQIALCESWKPCSNLCSRRWLKPSLNLVSNSTPLGSWQLKTLLPKGRTNFKRPFLKVFKLSELRMFRSSLFHSMTVEGKKELWIKLCSTLNWEMLLVFLVFYLFTVTVNANLCSRRWLKPSLNLVINSTPLGSWQLKTLLPKGRTNFKRPFLKVFKLSELRMFRSSLFHSMTVEGKKELWIKLCSTLNWEMLLVFLVFYLFTVTGMLKRYFGEWKLYRSSVVSGTIFLFKGIPNLAHYKVSL